MIKLGKTKVYIKGKYIGTAKNVEITGVEESDLKGISAWADQMSKFVKEAERSGKPIVSGPSVAMKPIDIHICRCGKYFHTASGWRRHYKKKHTYPRANKFVEFFKKFFK